jgi:Kef-type K+ transport system membrane component KefB
LFYFQGCAKGWSNAIWPESSLATFQLIADLGLIFFMFFLGIELDLEQIKKSWKTTIPISCASIIIPGKYSSFFNEKTIFNIQWVLVVQ